MREGKKLVPHTPYVLQLPFFLLTLFHSLLFQACTGLLRKADFGLLFFLFLHTFLAILSAIVVYCRLNKVSGLEWAVVWRWSNCVAVCICFCVQGSIASIICPHNVMCVLGDLYAIPSVWISVFVLHILFF